MKAYLTNNEALFVNKIFCLGLNYSDHIQEMQHEKPKEPVIFLKANSAISYDKAIIEIPSISNNMHYELELVLLIGKKGRNISLEQALSYIKGYGVGIDFTLRDLQEQAKAHGLPWTVSKSFDQSAFISNFINYNNENLNNLDLELRLNDQIKQQVNTSNMIFNIQEIVTYISSIFTLEAGDIIYTGTPSGIGQVKSGDKLEIFLDNQSKAYCIIK